MKGVKNMNKIQIITKSRRGMEMVQVAILVAIAIGLGMLFRERIGEFITATFDNLMNTEF
jgi:hypothetical protein